MNAGSMGRPLKLKPDAQTIGTLQGLGQIQATIRESAAVLGVSMDTLIAFLDRNNGKMRKIFDDAKETGKVSLRRTQFRQAQTHIAMAIFLGKNYLNQSDKAELTGSIQHTISAELHKLLMAQDGQQRSLPDYIEHDPGEQALLSAPDGAEEVREPGMANGQSLPDRKRNGSDGNV